MIPLNPATLRLVGIGLAVALLFSAGWKVRGWRADTEMAGVMQSLAERQNAAAEEARATERKQQEQVNAELQKQKDSLDGINAGLRRDLSVLLSSRPSRKAGVPGSSGADCTGGTGAELSREDAGFLVGEAARADTLRAALTACYGYADALAAR
jgi:hypothetical protein